MVERVLYFSGPRSYLGIPLELELQNVVLYFPPPLRRSNRLPGPLRLPSPYVREDLLMTSLRSGDRVAVWMGTAAGAEGTVERVTPSAEGYAWVVLRTETGEEVSTFSAYLEPVVEAEEPRVYAGTFYP